MTWPESSVGQRWYQGVGAMPMSGKFTCDPLGGVGGSIGWGSSALGANGPGLVGPIRGWSRVINPGSESESVFDSLKNWQSLEGASDISFTGNINSLNFTSQEISKHRWAVSQNWYPLDPGSYPTKIISQLFGSSLDLFFFKMRTQAWQPMTHWEGTRLWRRETPRDSGGKQQGIYMGNSSIYGYGYQIQNPPLAQPHIPLSKWCLSMSILELWKIKENKFWAKSLEITRIGTKRYQY